LKAHLIRNPLSLTQTGHNLYEKHDKDTLKSVCISCGGKGFYLLMRGVPGPNNTKGEVMPCELCEDGFKYSKDVEKIYGDG